jgi:hypothetical protein
MKAIVMTVLVSVSLYGQSKTDLRTKYGSPVSETFTVRPGIEVTATYSPTGTIVELLISPHIPDASISKTLGVKPIDGVVLKQIVDELVPMAKRGKPRLGGFLDIWCPPQDDCMGTVNEDWEKVSIYYHPSVNGGPSYAVIQFKPVSN